MCGGILEGLSGISTVLGLTKSSDASASTTTPETSTNLTSTAATDAVEAQRKKSALAQGYSSTIATGGSGVTSTATTQKKTLLGS